MRRAHRFSLLDRKGHMFASPDTNTSRRARGIKRGRVAGTPGERRGEEELASRAVPARSAARPIDMDMRQDPLVQHQFFMPQQPQPAMMDEASSFLAAGTGGGGEGGGTASSGRKRRFTEEQIRSLESMFHAHHAKLEPREKAELARELGLQPRQVAIWFQNKRARWRSKQLEHDYAALRAKYDALHARVEALRQEKLALAEQLNELSGRLREREEERAAGATAATASSSCCCGDEAEDDKRNVVLRCVDVPESCVLGGACATPADVVSVESECDNHHLDYGDGDGFPESFCATPELWEPWPWPLVEWNAVA